MKNIAFLLLLSFSVVMQAQHTFSIVAVDSITGEVGSAGATCGDSIIWPGTPGAFIISDVIPGVGAIHTQSYYEAINQTNANTRMDLGDSPQEIIDWLVANDMASNPSIRQYGVVDYNGGSPRAAAYTGANCFDYKNHIIGPNYAIQGNILLGQGILDSMESGFNNTDGCLADKLMAAMQGANVVGADTRCMSEGTSSLSAFIRVAQASDAATDLYLDINIAGTPANVEPIDELQTKYNEWKNNNNGACTEVTSTTDMNAEDVEVLIYPNPTDNILNLNVANRTITNIVMTDVLGSIVLERGVEKVNEGFYQLSLQSLANGVYFISLFEEKELLAKQKIILQRD